MELLTNRNGDHFAANVSKSSSYLVAKWCGCPWTSFVFAKWCASRYRWDFQWFKTSSEIRSWVNIQHSQAICLFYMPSKWASSSNIWPHVFTCLNGFQTVSCISATQVRLWRWVSHGQPRHIRRWCFPRESMFAFSGTLLTWHWLVWFLLELYNTSLIWKHWGIHCSVVPCQQ